MLTKEQQQLFGINDNIVNGIPRAYGLGEHHVELAYITPEEATILEKLDLYDSKPPHDGPKGIPNYNDGLGGAPGQGDAEAGGTSSASAGDNAAFGGPSQTGNDANNKGDTSTDTDPIGQMTGVVDSEGNPVGWGPTNALGNTIGTVMSTNPAYGAQQRDLARAYNAAQMAAIRSDPNLSMGDYNPSTQGGLNATDGLSFGESMGYNTAGVMSALGDMDPMSVMGSLAAAAMGVPSFVGGLVADQFGKFGDEESEGFNLGDMMSNISFGDSEHTYGHGQGRPEMNLSGTTIDENDPLSEAQMQIADLISRGFTEELATRLVDNGKYFESYAFS